MKPQAYIYLGGMLLLLLGERIFGAGDVLHLALSGMGLLAVLVSLGVIARDFAAAEPDQKPAHRAELGFAALGAASLIVYFLSTDLVIDKLKFADEDREHQVVVLLTALWPVLWLAGTLPFLAICRALHLSPVKVVASRIRVLGLAWLAAAFAVAMLFPLNFLAAERNKRWDLGYFKTAQPGTATLNLVSSLEVPVRAVLFFPRESDVTGEIRTYFEQLEGENFVVEFVDHALEPELSKELKVRDNGYITLVRGEGEDQQIERVKVGSDFDSAKRTLKTLDSEVFQALMKVARGPRVAYVTVGHGEMYWKSDLERDRRLNDLKKLLRQLNFKVKELGLTDGLATEIPEDATVVFVIAPEQDLLPEEKAALNAYRLRGGALFIAVEPGGPALTELLQPLGVAVDPTATLAIDRNYIPITNRLIDRVNLVTNKFSTHESITTLSRNSRTAFVITPGPTALSKLTEEEGKLNVTVKTLEETWADYNGDLNFDATAPAAAAPPAGAPAPEEGAENAAIPGVEIPGAPRAEKRQEWPLAIATSGPVEGGAEGAEWRAIVTADATWMTDLLLKDVPANQVWLQDSLAWLTNDAASAGTINEEKDVKIQHTKEGQGWIFYSTAFLIPLGFLVGGLARVRLRRNRA